MRVNAVVMISSAGASVSTVSSSQDLKRVGDLLRVLGGRRCRE